MKLSSTFVLRASLLSVALASPACGKFHKKDKKAPAAAEGAALGTCYSLGAVDPNYPGQNPTIPVDPYYPDNGPGAGDDYDQGGDTDVVVVVPPKGDEPPPPPPGSVYPTTPPTQPTYPGQVPCQPTTPPPPPPNQCQGKGCDVYHPIDQDDDFVPTAYPGQNPTVPGTCGQAGVYCNDGKGGPGQWPTEAIGGLAYDQGSVQGCIDSFQRGGYAVQGQWQLQVREIKNVSLLSHDVISDIGVQPSIVVIKSYAALGSVEFQLLNPNALYCIEKNINLAQNVYFTSCHTSNIVFGTDINLLSTTAGQVVDCR